MHYSPPHAFRARRGNAVTAQLFGAQNVRCGERTSSARRSHRPRKRVFMVPGVGMPYAMAEQDDGMLLVEPREQLATWVSSTPPAMASGSVER